MFRISILLFGLYLLFRQGGKEEQTRLVSYKDQQKHESSVFDKVVEFYSLQGIKFAEVPVAQSYWETGGFVSAIYKENKNPFGMKYNSRGLATGVNRGHATYPNQIAALKDYAAWQRTRIAAFERRFHKIRTTEDYINMLDSLVIGNGMYRYAEDTCYTKHIRSTLAILREL